MKFCGVLFTSLLACCVAVESFNLLDPVARRLSSRIKRQNTGGDPNLEAVFGQQNGNSNFGNGQSSSGGNGPPPFGFGFSGPGQSNNNGGFGGFNNNAGSSNNNNQNQGWPNNGAGGFNNFGTGGGFDTQGSNSGGFNNFGSTQGGSSGNGGFNNQGFGNNGGFSNGQGQGSSFGNGQNSQNNQRPQTTQRTPLNLISGQNTIDNTECARLCRTRATQQYNPVCGSDNISYSNQQVFDCYQRECRRDVSVVYSGSCVTTRVPQTSSTPNSFS